MISKWTWSAIQIYRWSYGILPTFIFDFDFNFKTKEANIVTVKWNTFSALMALLGLFTLLLICFGSAYVLLGSFYHTQQMEMNILQIGVCIGACIFTCAGVGILLSLYCDWDCIQFMNLMMCNQLSYRMLTSLSISTRNVS